MANRVSLSVDDVQRLKSIARDLPSPIKPIKCVNCGCELYLIAHSGCTGVAACPECGELPVDSNDIDRLVEFFGTLDGVQFIDSAAVGGNRG